MVDRSRSRSPPPPLPPPPVGCLRDFLAEASRRNWDPASLADRQMDLSKIMERAQLMTAQHVALKMLNEVFAEMSLTTHNDLWSAVRAAGDIGILNDRQRLDLQRLNRSANRAKHETG